MPLVSTNKKNGLWLWEMIEDEKFFLDNVTLNSEEQDKVLSFANSQRRMEFLCSRHILQNVIGIKSDIIYNSNGKPFLKGKNQHISISHSKNLVGIYTDCEKIIGLDIEIIHPKIEKISNRFINKDEWIFVDKDNPILSYVLIWSAKEAVLKIHGNRTLDFKKNIKVLPFSIEKEGLLNCQLITDSGVSDINLDYFRHKDYYIVYGA